MKIVNPTKLRKELFANIENAIKGIPIFIKTKKGNVVLISEELMNRLSYHKKDGLLQPKIPGKINGDLNDADEKLRKYIRIPS